MQPFYNNNFFHKQQFLQFWYLIDETELFTFLTIS